MFTKLSLCMHYQGHVICCSSIWLDGTAAVDTKGEGEGGGYQNIGIEYGSMWHIFDI